MNDVFQVDWMGEKTKNAALKKLSNIVAHVGVPSEWFDDKKLDEYYENLEINSVSFLRCYLSVNLFNMKRKFEQLRKPVDRATSIDKGTYYSANYMLNQNSIGM